MPPYAVRDLVTATTVTLGLIFHMLYLIIYTYQHRPPGDHLKDF